MDPNETLKRIRELVRLSDCAALDFAELAEHISALDEWLTKGGFLPAQWQGAAR